MTTLLTAPKCPTCGSGNVDDGICDRHGEEYACLDCGCQWTVTLSDLAFLAYETAEERTESGF
jgi:transposase-like protein